MADKKRVGLIAAGIGMVFSLLALVFYKMFPKMKECCEKMREKCCPPGSKMEEMCCRPKKKK